MISSAFFGGMDFIDWVIFVICFLLWLHEDFYYHRIKNLALPLTILIFIIIFVIIFKNMAYFIEHINAFLIFAFILLPFSLLREELDKEDYSFKKIALYFLVCFFSVIYALSKMMKSP